jgi:hypothetical protein
MKKIFLFLLVISLFTIMPAQIKFGIEAGINISNVKGKDPSIIGGSSGFLTGVKAGYNLLDFISVESGLYLSQKGMDRIIFPDIQGVEKYNYLEVPVNLFFTLPIHDFGKTSLLAGFYAARLVSADIVPDNEGQSSAVSLNEIIPANDYGLNFGIRQSLNVSSGWLNFGIKYSFGLKSLDQPYDVIKYGERIISDGSKKLYNSVVAITVGYTY